MGLIDKLLKKLTRNDWHDINRTRLQNKRRLLKITKKTVARNKLIKEIKWLEERSKNI